MATTTIFPNGCFPTMITPMNEDKSINYTLLDAMVEWYIQSGCTGLFANCLSSEMYHLTEEERLEVTRRVKAKAAGRVTVVASGTFAGTVEEQAEFVKKIGAIADAVVVIVCNMAKQDEGDDVWKANVEKLLSLTDNVPLGLYECPVPYHRLLSPETLKWAASTGRFFFHKDTCCQAEPIKAKLKELQSLGDANPFRFYNANIATLEVSNLNGASGFSGISANFYPQVLVHACKHVGEPGTHRVHQMLAVCENVVMYKYPTAAKAFLSLFPGFPIKVVCRNQDFVLNEEEMLKLQALHDVIDDLCKELGVPRLNPAQFL